MPCRLERMIHVERGPNGIISNVARTGHSSMTTGRQQHSMTSGIGSINLVMAGHDNIAKRPALARGCSRKSSVSIMRNAYILSRYTVRTSCQPRGMLTACERFSIVSETVSGTVSGTVSD